MGIASKLAEGPVRLIPAKRVGPIASAFASDISTEMALVPCVCGPDLRGRKGDQPMPRTIGEIRRADRERKRRQRAEAAAAGVPSSQQVNIAIVEALSFASSAGVNIEAARAGEQPAIGVATILSAAHKILVHRLGFDGEASKAALLKALAPRQEHRWPSFVPTHYAGPMPIDAPPSAG